MSLRRGSIPALSFVLSAVVVSVNCGGGSGDIPALVTVPTVSVSPSTIRSAVSGAVAAMKKALTTGTGSVGKSFAVSGATAPLATVRPAVIVTVPINFHQVFTSPCPVNGFVQDDASMNGSVTATENSVDGSASYNSAETFGFCSYDQTWVFKSDSAVRIQGPVTFNASHIIASLGISGAFYLEAASGQRVNCHYNTALLQFDNLTGVSLSGTVECDGGISVPLSGS